MSDRNNAYFDRPGASADSILRDNGSLIDYPWGGTPPSRIAVRRTDQRCALARGAAVDFHDGRTPSLPYLSSTTSLPANVTGLAWGLDGVLYAAIYYSPGNSYVYAWNSSTGTWDLRGAVPPPGVASLRLTTGINAESLGTWQESGYNFIAWRSSTSTTYMDWYASDIPVNYISGIYEVVSFQVRSCIAVDDKWWVAVSDARGRTTAGGPQSSKPAANGVYVVDDSGATVGFYEWTAGAAGGLHGVAVDGAGGIWVAHATTAAPDPVVRRVSEAGTTLSGPHSGFGSFSVDQFWGAPALFGAGGLRWGGLRFNARGL